MTEQQEMNARFAHKRTHPKVSGRAGAYIVFSARSSVPINRDQLCNPAVITSQEKSTSGFYSGAGHVVRDALSTLSGNCSKLKTSPTVVRIRSQLCAANSLRTAFTPHFLAPREQSPRLTIRAISPRRGFMLPLKPGQRFFVR
jgi:hypothetical protein